MSEDRVSWALRQRVGGAPRKMVLIAAVMACDENSVASVARIAEIAELPEDFVRRALGQLRDQGVLAVATAPMQPSKPDLRVIDGGAE